MASGALGGEAAIPADERELVACLRRGDTRAFDQLADRYLPGLYRFAHRRLGGDRELTRDLVQSTMCKAIASLDGYRGDAPLFTWLCACCRNEIAMHFRRLDRRPREVPLEVPSIAAAADDAAPARPGPEELLTRAETAELVHVALDLLPESYNRALQWRYLDGIDVPEIARRLAQSYKATESLLSRARQAFRSAFVQAGGSGTPALAAAPARRAQR